MTGGGGLSMIIQHDYPDGTKLFTVYFHMKEIDKGILVYDGTDSTSLVNEELLQQGGKTVPSSTNKTVKKGQALGLMGGLQNVTYIKYGSKTIDCAMGHEKGTHSDLSNKKHLHFEVWSEKHTYIYNKDKYLRNPGMFLPGLREEPKYEKAQIIASK